MKRPKILVTVFLLLSVSLLVSFSIIENSQVAAGATAANTEDWERAKAYTLEYLNASTDEVINFKPTPEMRTFGQQMLHIAEANYGLASLAAGKTSPVAFGALEKSDKFKAKDAVTKEVMASYDFVIATLKELPDSKKNEMVKFFNFDVSRGGALEKVFEHQTHHRGQATVYLRLKGITPPQEKLF